MGGSFWRKRSNAHYVEQRRTAGDGVESQRHCTRSEAVSKNLSGEQDHDIHNSDERSRRLASVNQIDWSHYPNCGDVCCGIRSRIPLTSRWAGSSTQVTLIAAQRLPPMDGLALPM